MTQQGLIQKTINYVGMDDCNPNWTPTTLVALSANPNNNDAHKDHFKWNYATTVDMLQYLAISTRPNIVFTVSQVSHFTHHPKKSYSTAMKTITRHLKRTEDKSANDCFQLDCFVDADFAGMYKPEPD
jgi:hypothetical protein